MSIGRNDEEGLRGLRGLRITERWVKRRPGEEEKMTSMERMEFFSVEMIAGCTCNP